MARITLESLRHSYLANPLDDADWALRQIDVEWADGGAYALLGPSGCGKSTMLNIISGLLQPSEGRVLFDGRDVTPLDPVDRHVAQIFQFPVVYDTMSVYDNLAFPLRNRGLDASNVDARVREVAAMLDLGAIMSSRAAGLTADAKQKISLGRGLVRSDVNVVMFDEPLTVIDPHLKWVLRSKLKEVHQEFGNTMIYVTHDQVEALTFADKVVVMYEGDIVQIGTPVELFEKPQHTFVGYFIGSPGMNIIPCELDGGAVVVDGVHLPVAAPVSHPGPSARLEVGVRPEFVRFADEGMAVEVSKVDDLGRHKVVELRRGAHTIKMLLGESDPLPSQNAKVCFDPDYTRVYADGWAVA
jgi:glycerol transport system ATP-binding protein